MKAQVRRLAQHKPPLLGRTMAWMSLVVLVVVQTSSFERSSRLFTMPFALGFSINNGKPSRGLCRSFTRIAVRGVSEEQTSILLAASTQHDVQIASSADTTGSSPSLQDFDPEIATLISLEEDRQRDGLELIASENFCSKAVREAIGSCLTNKYSEGMVNQRYYGGNIFIDQIEQLCMDRALQLFHLDPIEWGVNVQPYSGSPANFAVYTALLQPHDRIMGLDLPSGGHLTHGFQTAKGKRVSATSLYFESMPYVVDVTTGLIDYDDLEYRATMFKPKLLIAGGSAYPREWNYQRISDIAKKVGAIFMVDMAHISGLVAANNYQYDGDSNGIGIENPFAFADIVTSTTHKTLRGPRSGMIFARSEYIDAINAAVFPSLQGGPHNHQIGALAVALKEAMTPSFRQYAVNVLQNAKALARGLQQKGHVLATDGTDNHLLLWNIRDSCKDDPSIKLTGSKVEKVLELASITVNKNSIAGDVSALNPGGVRLGTPALTTRGLSEEDFEKDVANFLHRGFQISLRVEQSARDRKAKQQQDEGVQDDKKPLKVLLKDFVAELESIESLQEEITELREEVEMFASNFPMPSD